MTVYVWHDGGWHDKRTGQPMDAPEGIFRPAVLSDVTYKSPLSGKVITSRSQRREEMKVHNVREVDPSEWRPTYNRRENAIRARGEHEPRPKAELGEGYQRLPRKALPSRIAKTLA